MKKRVISLLLALVLALSLLPADGVRGGELKKSAHRSRFAGM